MVAGAVSCAVAAAAPAAARTNPSTHRRAAVASATRGTARNARSVSAGVGPGRGVIENNYTTQNGARLTFRVHADTDARTRVVVARLSYEYQLRGDPDCGVSSLQLSSYSQGPSCQVSPRAPAGSWRCPRAASCARPSSTPSATTKRRTPTRTDPPTSPRSRTASWCVPPRDVRFFGGPDKVRKRKGEYPVIVNRNLGGGCPRAGGGVSRAAGFHGRRTRDAGCEPQRALTSLQCRAVVF